MSTLRTWRLAVLLAGGMSAAAFAGHRGENVKPYALTLDALVGSAGTDVVFQVSAAGGEALPAEAENVLLWATTARGRVLAVRMFRDVPLLDGKGVLEDLSIPAHARVSAVVEVRIAGSRRMQVLTANTVAADRPDLQIARVFAPAQVAVGRVANIEVLVQEIRGYRGARFDVLLLENGIVIDTVTGATVDPMGSTTALFAVRFETAGNHVLTALIADAAPAEYDTTNNSTTFGILATEALPMAYSMTYHRTEGEFSDNFTTSTTETRLSPGSTEVRTTEQESRYEEIGRHESFNYSATSDRYVSGVIDFAATIRVDGADKATLAVSRWSPFSSKSGEDWAETTYQAYDPDTDAHVYLDSYQSPKGVATVLQYTRNAGDYTFHSSGYQRFWATITVTDPVTGEVTTTTQSGGTTSSDSGTVVSGIFLDAFQKLQVGATVAFGGTVLGGWTGEHEVQMTSVDRTWDQTDSRPGHTQHTWGYERRTIWDAKGSGVTTP